MFSGEKALWGASSIQFVWFVQSAEKLRAHSIYEKLTGEEPVTMQTNKIPSPANPLLGVAAGGDSLNAVQVQIQPGRVDAIITPSEEAQAASDQLPTVDTHAVVSNLNKRIAEAGDFLGQPVNRLAIVANLILPVPGMREGVDLAMKISGFTPTVRPDSEFIVQLNNRTKLQGTEINRLVRYSVMSMQNITFSFDPNVGVPSGFPSAATQYAALTMLDFNTIPTGAWIDAEKQRTILAGLSGEILRVAETCEISTLE